MQSTRISRHNLNWQIPAFISAMVLAISLVLVVPVVLDAQVSMATQLSRGVQMAPNHNGVMVEIDPENVRSPYILGSLGSESETPLASTDGQ